MELDAFEKLLATQRAIRLYTDRPVEDALVERVLRAATRSPSSHNAQPWRFVVVRDRDVKRRIGAIFDELGQRMAQAAPDHTPWEDVPVLIAVCAVDDMPGVAGGPSIFPAVQNLLLAAHAAGLGSVLTVRWRSREPEVKEMLGIPENVSVQAIVPLGWPDREYGRARRLPLPEVAYRERFGEKW
jgi:nitroreductase